MRPSATRQIGKLFRARSLSVTAQPQLNGIYKEDPPYALRMISLPKEIPACNKFPAPRRGGRLIDAPLERLGVPRDVTGSLAAP